MAPPCLCWRHQKTHEGKRQDDIWHPENSQGSEAWGVCKISLREEAGSDGCSPGLRAPHEEEGGERQKEGVVEKGEREVQRREGGGGEMADGRGSWPLPGPSAPGRAASERTAARALEQSTGPGVLRCPFGWWMVGGPEGPEEGLGEGRGCVVGTGDSGYQLILWCPWSPMPVGDGVGPRVLPAVPRIPEVDLHADK